MAGKRTHVAKITEIERLMKLGLTSRAIAKTAYSDGTSHLLFTPGEFIEKLSAIIPPPKSHLVKWSGVFAPNSPCRKKVVLKPDEKKAKSPKRSCNEDIPLKNSSWSKMLAKVFIIDVTQCQYCKGEMAILAQIMHLFFNLVT